MAVAIIGSSAATTSIMQTCQLLLCKLAAPHELQEVCLCHKVITCRRPRVHPFTPVTRACAGFSLSALEETMQESKRLSNSAAQSALLACCMAFSMLSSRCCTGPAKACGVEVGCMQQMSGVACVGRRIRAGGHAEAGEGPEPGAGQSTARRPGGAGEGADPAGASASLLRRMRPH